MFVCLSVCVCVLCVLCVCVVCVGFMVWGFTCGCGCWFQGFGLVMFGAPRPPFPGPPFPWTAQNFASGVSHDNQRAQKCTLERPGASNTTKIPQEDPRREKKRTNYEAGEGKKERNFWLPHLSAPHFLWVWARGLHPSMNPNN